MNIRFIVPKPENNMPTEIVAEAELVFGDGEPLSGMKLVGFSIRKSRDGQHLYVLLPSRPFGVGEKRQYFDFLRSADEHHADTGVIKRKILDAWAKHQAT